jgi:hypothetical protein
LDEYVLSVRRPTNYDYNEKVAASIQPFQQAAFKVAIKVKLGIDRMKMPRFLTINQRSASGAR